MLATSDTWHIIKQMADYDVVLGRPESYETNCFGDDHDIDWERSYTATMHGGTPSDVVAGRVHYVAPNDLDNLAAIDVDLVEVGGEIQYRTAREVFAAFTDDEVATSLVLEALPKIVEIRDIIRESRTGRSLE